MRLKKLHYVSGILGAGLFLLALSSFSGGIPGQSAGGCTCHAAAPSSATIIDITGRPAGGYVNGQTYNLSLTVTNGAQVAAGFDMTVDNGTLATSGTGTVLLGTQEIIHTSPKMMVGGTSTWAFTWTAPASGNATATFTISGNAVNLNGGNDIGDIWNTTNITIAAASSGAQAPTVTLGTITGITSSGATVNGTVNAHNATTAVSVEYGLTTGYGQTAAASPASVTGNTASAIAASLSGLAANTLYHYRIKAVNSAGTTYSPDATFTTAGVPALPTVTVSAVSGLTSVAATLNATVNANNASTAISVQYGLTSSYGSTAAVSPSPLTGNTATAVSAGLTGLAPLTTYHYRFVAVNSVGTVNSSDFTFTTLTNVGLPIITVGTPSGITTSTATINGTINANNATTTVTIQYGLTATYGSTINANPGFVAGNAPLSITGALSGLAAATTYHYRIVAVNSAGTVNSPDQTFTTAGLPGLPIITLGTPSNISYNRGVVNATVNANNATTTVSVEYGLSSAYGNTLSMSPSQVSGATAAAVSATLNQLLSNTLYHYRVVATNSSGTARSGDATFTTTNNNVSVGTIEDGAFRVFPNPATDRIVLTGKSPVNMEVIGMDGKRFELSYTAIGKNQYGIDITRLPSGMYFIRLTNEGKLYNVRFSKR